MEFKVLSFNIHKGIGWHRFQSTFQWLDTEVRLLSPDFIFFQEILGAQAEHIVSDLWSHYSYGKNVIYNKGNFGNAIFSKLPIIFSENFDLTTNRFERRGLLHSIVKLPNGSPLHLLCVHLGLFKKSRQKQYQKIISYIESVIKENEPIILGGDFNDWRSHATVPLVKGLGLSEAFMMLHGKYARTFPAWSPLLKLDRIYSRGMQVKNAERLMNSSWRKISDHIAIMVEVSFEGKREI